MKASSKEDITQYLLELVVLVREGKIDSLACIYLEDDSIEGFHYGTKKTEILGLLEIAKFNVTEGLK